MESEALDRALSVSQNQNLSPLVTLALSREIDLERVDRLIAVQNKFEESHAKTEFYKAFSLFKQHAPVITKDSYVEFSNKTGKTTRYAHASLANVMNTVTPLLSEQGLAISWIPVQEQNKIVVTAVLSHMLGYSVSASLHAQADTTGQKNPLQSIGSTITYLERYTTLALLGLATTDDDGEATASDPRQQKIDNSESQVTASIMNAPTLENLEILCNKYKNDYKTKHTNWTIPEWNRICSQMKTKLYFFKPLKTTDEKNVEPSPKLNCGF